MQDISRRKFVKMASAALAGVGLTGISGIVSGCGKEQASAQPKAAPAKSVAEAAGKPKPELFMSVTA